MRARLNTEIDAGGRPLTNRDTLKILDWTGEGENREAVAVRQTGPGEWSAPFSVPAAYLEQHAELAYAGNVYVAQGRTVDTAHLVVDESMTRDMLYVGMTRGREKNLAHVITGPPDPADLSRDERRAFTRDAVQRAGDLAAHGEQEAARRMPLVPPEPDSARIRAPWESVVAAAMERDEPLGTAIEHLRDAQEFATNTRHLYELAEAGWWQDVVPQIDEMVRARIGDHDYQRYMTDPERPALLQTLRQHEIGGRPIPDVLDAITARPLDGARSIAAVLHGRAGKEPAPVRGETRTWTERAPQAAPAWVQEAYRELDQRQGELGEQLAARPPQWAVEAWGQPPQEPGVLLEDWKQRAAEVQSYRELAGITDPRQAIGPPPARQAGLTEAFAAAVRALQLADEAALLKAMGRGDLEARVREHQRAAAAAPPDVRTELESVTRQREHSQEQARRARANGDETLARSAEALARAMEAQQERLRVADAARQEWAEATAGQAEAARQAQDELRRRGREADNAGPAETEQRAAQETPGLDEDEARRWREAQARVAEGIRDQNRTLPAEPEPTRETPAADPEAWRELKAAQTARVNADRAARREAAARAIPVTDAELERYGQAAVSPEAEAALERIQADADAAEASAARRAGAEAARAAELDEADLEETARLDVEADAQAASEGVWEPGTSPAEPASEAGAEADAGLEI